MNDYLIIILIFLVYFSPAFYQFYLASKGNKAHFKKFARKLLSIATYGLILFGLTMGCIAVLSHTNYLDYESPKTFDEYDEISFENFRGLEFFKKELYGNERFAYVVTEIDVEVKDNFVAVQSLFHPSRSFVYDNNSTSDELLRHEKYHFKITELFARKIKKQLSDLSAISKADIDRILSLTQSAERKYQQAYDYNTFHSYVYGEQVKYEKEIDSLLNLYSDYKNPKVYFNAKN